MSKVITTITINLSGSVEVDLTEDDIKKIATKYGGDYQEYISEMSFSNYDIEYEREDEEYSEAIIRNALHKYRDENDLTEDFELPPYKIMENLLEECQVSYDSYFSTHRTLKPIDLKDKFNIKRIVDVADINNPKHELNCVYFDAENIVATDTRRVIVQKNPTEYKDLFIPKAFLEKYLTDEDARLFCDEDKNIWMKLTSELGTYSRCYKFYIPSYFKFPDYNRIIPIKEKYKISIDTFKSKAVDVNSAISAYSYASKYDLVGYKFDKEQCVVINKDYIVDGFEMLSINESGLPIKFYSDDCIYVVMPIFIDEKEKKNVIKFIESNEEKLK